MKNKHQAIKVLLLISIYCFGIYASANTLSNFSIQKVSENKLQKEFSETSTKAIYTHIKQFENSISYFTKFLSSDFEQSFNDFWAISYTNHLLTNAKFKQYNNYLNTQQIRQRKSNLIFPFHNFW